MTTARRRDRRGGPLSYEAGPDPRTRCARPGRRGRGYRAGSHPALSEAQRLGSYVHPDTAETIERIDMLGNAWLKRNPNVPKVPFLDIDRSDDFESITVQQAAAQLGVSDTAVKARLRNESLRSVKRGGRWRVDAEAVRREAVCR